MICENSAAIEFRVANVPRVIPAKVGMQKIWADDLLRMLLGGWGQQRRECPSALWRRKASAPATLSPKTAARNARFPSRGE
jgi:hypothetical protein